MQTVVDVSKATTPDTWIEIRRKHVIHNLKLIQSKTLPGTDVLAVIKANAYGHGLVEVASLLGEHVSYLGISSKEEALTLRNADIRSPLFMFGRLLESDLDDLITKRITFTVSNFQEAQILSQMAESHHQFLTAHIKVDTGMGRFGIPLRVAFDEIQRISALPCLNLEGLYTHFPTAEKEDGFLEKQVYDFSRLVQQLSEIGITFRYRHAANSSASIKLNSPVFNMVRPGLSLYGVAPHEKFKEECELLPALSLKSRVISIKDLEVGDAVGYGREFVAKEPTRIAILPIGYSHGYPFRLSSRSYVLFEGKRLPIAGRISMDYIMVVIGNEPVELGDTFALIGDEGEGIRTEDLADWAQTIPYEILTRLDTRIPRLYP